MIPEPVFGIPVVFDRASPRLADARGVWRKFIAIGPAFFTLSGADQRAVLYHEAGHCVHRHMEKRLVLLPLLFLAPWIVRRIARAQEIEADRFAAEHGLRDELAAFLVRSKEPKSIFYPSHEERVRALQGVNP